MRFQTAIMKALWRWAPVMKEACFATLPAAKSGILAGVILGVGQSAIGETMAVIMVAGNQPRVCLGHFPGNPYHDANIVLEMGYATDLHRGALIPQQRCCSLYLF